MIIFRIHDGIHDGINDGINEGINLEKFRPNERKILQCIGNPPKITIKELSEEIGVSTSTVDRKIEKLKEKGALERVGSKKTGYWKLNIKSAEYEKDT